MCKHVLPGRLPQNKGGFPSCWRPERWHTLCDLEVPSIAFSASLIGPGGQGKIWGLLKGHPLSDCPSPCQPGAASWSSYSPSRMPPSKSRRHDVTTWTEYWVWKLTYCDIFKKSPVIKEKRPVHVVIFTVCRRKLKKKIWLILWNVTYPSEQIEDTVTAWPNAELRREMAILRLIFSVVQLWGLWGLWGGGEKMVKNRSGLVSWQQQ